MAIFEIAFKRTEKFEGANIWTNTPGDSGKETWSGISRSANPRWEGWKILDNIPNKQNGKKYWNEELERLKQKLYKENYWNPVWGDLISRQAVANDLYDSAVNMGVKTAIKLTERVYLMRETGKMSNELLTKLNKII